jgi:hypothetical protein
MPVSQIAPENKRERRRFVRLEHDLFRHERLYVPAIRADVTKYARGRRFEPENVIAIGYKRSVNPLTPSIVGPAGCLRGSAALAPRAAEIAAVLGTPIGEVSTASRGRRLREKLSH